MAVKLLFEDKETTPSSILLKHSMHGNNIYFSGGSSNLLRKLNDIYTPPDIIFVMHDVSPNNKWTIKFYDSFVQEIKSKPQDYRNVYVVPIVCMEFYICKCLYKYKYLHAKDKEIKRLIAAIVKEPFDYNKVPKSILSIAKLNKSLEKMYKYIVSNQAMKCIYNKFEYDDKSTMLRKESIYGIFYEKNCTCEDMYCDIKCNDGLSIKSERLYTLLPVFAVDSEEHKKLLNELDIRIKNIDIATIQCNIQKFYDEICSSININTIKILV